MGRNLRVQLMLSLPALGVMAGLCVRLTLLSGVFGEENGIGRLLSGCACISSNVVPVALMVIAGYTGKTGLNLWLSLGARRRDWFWALQILFLLCTLAGRLTVLLASALPDLAGWTVSGGLNILCPPGMPGNRSCDLLCLAEMVPASLAGVLAAKRPLLAFVIFCGGFIAGIIGLFVLSVGLVWAQTEPGTALPAGVGLGALAVLFLGEPGLWCAVARACVY